MSTEPVATQDETSVLHAYTRHWLATGQTELEWIEQAVAWRDRHAAWLEQAQNALEAFGQGDARFGELFARWQQRLRRYEAWGSLVTLIRYQWRDVAQQGLTHPERGAA